MSLRCEHVEKSLPSFIYEDLSPGEMGRLGIHLGRCPSCWKAYVEDRAIVELADRFLAPSIPVDIARVLERARGESRGGPVAPRRSTRGLVRLAAGLVLGAGLAAGLLLALASEDSEPEAPAGSSALESPEPRVEESPPPSIAENAGPRPETPPARADLPRARAVLAMAASIDLAGRGREFRARLAETGIEVDRFLAATTLEGAIHLARAAFAVLAETSGGVAVDLAGRILAARSDLAGEALAFLGSTRDPRALGALESAYRRSRSPELAAAIARKGTPLAARALARCVKTDRGIDLGSWRALLSMEPVSSASALAPFLGSEELRPDAALRLAWAGDKAAIGPLVSLALAGGPRRAEAISALERLARGAPAPFARIVREAGGAEGAEPRLALEILGSAAPTEVARLVFDFARASGSRRAALDIARSLPTPEVARALVPLGGDRALAGDAVSLAASLGPAGIDALRGFLDTRYGRDPALEAIHAIRQGA